MSESIEEIEEIERRRRTKQNAWLDYQKNLEENEENETKETDFHGHKVTESPSGITAKKTDAASKLMDTTLKKI